MPFSAKEYLEAELQRDEANAPLDFEIRTRQASWINEDWFDFVERYADYIAEVEKS